MHVGDSKHSLTPAVQFSCGQSKIHDSVARWWAGPLSRTALARPSLLLHGPSLPTARSPSLCVTETSLTRDVRALSGDSVLSVATDPSTLMSMVEHCERRSHTLMAWPHRGLVPVDPGPHLRRQAPRLQGAPTKASRSRSHGKSLPEKTPRPRVIRLVSELTLASAIDDAATAAFA